jgi:predicted DNA binding CopG/RHH family protein
MQNQDDKVLINLRMKRSLVDEMRQAADRMEIPYSQFIRLAIKQLLEKEKETINEPAS